MALQASRPAVHNVGKALGAVHLRIRLSPTCRQSRASRGRPAPAECGCRWCRALGQQGVGVGVWVGGWGGVGWGGGRGQPGGFVCLWSFPCARNHRPCARGCMCSVVGKTCAEGGTTWAASHNANLLVWPPPSNRSLFPSSQVWLRGPCSAMPHPAPRATCVALTGAVLGGGLELHPHQPLLLRTLEGGGSGSGRGGVAPLRHQGAGAAALELPAGSGASAGSAGSNVVRLAGKGPAEGGHRAWECSGWQDRITGTAGATAACS